jgi:hypothetical protein
VSPAARLVAASCLTSSVRHRTDAAVHGTHTVPRRDPLAAARTSLVESAPRSPGCAAQGVRQRLTFEFATTAHSVGGCRSSRCAPRRLHSPPRAAPARGLRLTIARSRSMQPRFARQQINLSAAHRRRHDPGRSSLWAHTARSDSRYRRGSRIRWRASRPSVSSTADPRRSTPRTPTKRSTGTACSSRSATSLPAAITSRSPRSVTNGPIAPRH